MGILNLEPEGNLSSCRKYVFAFIALSIIILTTYSNTFHSSWHFDDEKILRTRQLHLSELNWQNIKKTFFSLPKQPGKLYRPVSSFSLALNYYFSKDKVFGYHLVNVIIHYITAVFLFLFMYNSLNLPSIKAKYSNHSYSIALLASLFWASNPIQTQAVTYIIQRMASMAGMFYIISIYFYMKARIAKIPHIKIILLSLCVIAGIMAMGSKENAFMLPVSIYLFDLFIIQGLTKETLKKNVKPASLIIFLIICIGITYYFLSDKDLSVLSYRERTFNLKERLLSEPRIILFYLSLIYYPIPTRLSIEHDVTISKTLLSPPTTLFSILFIVAILFFAFYLSRRRPFIAFSIIFFFLNHLIESSFVPLELVFEHRNYIPSMFLFIPVVVLLLKAIKYYSSKKPLQIVIIIFTICLLVGQGNATFIRNALWKTEESLWMAATEKAYELWRPWHNLGKYYGDKNMHKEALAHYLTALRKKINIHPLDKRLTLYNIGVEYHKMGQKDKAFLYYLKTEQIYPSLPNMHNNKGIILAEKGCGEEAIYEFNEAIRYDKNLYQAYSNLGFLLLKMERIEEAIQQLEMALKLKPDNVSNLLRLGYAYRKKGLYGKAFIQYKRAQERDPHGARVLLYLSEIYLIKGMNVHADRSLEQFIEISKGADLRVLLEEIIEKGEKFDKIQVDKKVFRRLLSKVYLKKKSLISSLKVYLDKNSNSTGEGEVIP
jgi:tetratricopeptide (TPR) repeat protein